MIDNKNKKETGIAKENIFSKGGKNMTNKENKIKETEEEYIERMKELYGVPPLGFA